MGWLSYAMTFSAIFVGLAAVARHNQEWMSTHTEPFPRFKSYGDSTKPSLVIIPGLDGATTFFADVIPELTPYFHVVMFHLPTVAPPLSKAAAESEKYSFPFIAKKLALVMDEAGIDGNTTVVGESFGGMVAQRFALDFPARVHRLILLSSLAKPDVSPAVQFKVNFVLPVVETVGHLVPFLAQSFFALAHLPEVVESHEPQWTKHLFLKEAMWAHHYSVMARIKIALTFDTRHELANIKHGALIVFGKDDTFTMTGTRQLLDGIPRATEQGLPGGHLCHITSPKAFSSAIITYVTAK